MIKISDFLIHFNKYSETKFYIKKFNLKFIKINKTENFYMGYLSSKNSLKGEFLNIEKNKKNITLKNDQFGTYPVYYIKENNEIYISNSIKLIKMIKNSSSIATIAALLISSSLTEEASATKVN